MSEARVHGYARVSTKEQNEARQIITLKEQGVADRDMYIDKVSGKSFERPEYKRLLNALRKDDLLIVPSIDRLGRDYTEVQEQWRHITQEIGAHIKVLDMPLLDTSTQNNLDSQFVADLVLQILSYVAQKERESINRRQRQGIDAMPIDENGKRVSAKTGRPVGKPRAEKPENWLEVYTEWRASKITAVKAMQILNLKPNTFYKFANEEDTAQGYKRRTVEEMKAAQGACIERAIAPKGDTE